MISERALLEPVVARLCESPAVRALATTSQDFYSDIESGTYAELVREVINEVAAGVAAEFEAIGRAAANVDDDRHPAFIAALEAAHLAARARGTTYTCVYGRCGGASITTTEHGIASRWMDAHVEENPHSGDWPVTFRVNYPASNNPGVEYRDAVLLDDANTFSTGPLVPQAGRDS